MKTDIELLEQIAEIVGDAINEVSHKSVERDKDLLAMLAVAMNKIIELEEKLDKLSPQLDKQEIH